MNVDIFLNHYCILYPFQVWFPLHVWTPTDFPPPLCQHEWRGAPRWPPAHSWWLSSRKENRRLFPWADLNYLDPTTVAHPEAKLILMSLLGCSGVWWWWGRMNGRGCSPGGRWGAAETPQGLRRDSAGKRVSFPGGEDKCFLSRWTTSSCRVKKKEGPPPPRARRGTGLSSLLLSLGMFPCRRWLGIWTNWN